MTDKREDVARIDSPELTAEQRAISAAATVFRNHGMDIGCPWEGSLDDVEQERFKALVEAINAYKFSAPQDRDVGGDWRFTPMEVEMLLHLYAIAEPLPRMFATVREAALQSFIERGFVRPSKSSGSGYRTTKLGERVVNAICNPSTPPSVAVIPDGVRNALEQAKDRLEAVQRHQDFGARLPSVQAALAQVRAALIPLPASPSVAVPEGKILTTYNPCLAKLRDGEPFFVLLGRDKQAPDTVDFWATERAKAEGVSDWTKQAHEVASEMRAYSASPSPNAPVTTGEKLEAEEKEMFRLADRLGYVCTPEPPHPDSPHVQEQEETLIAIKDEAREEAAIELERIAATLTSNDDGPAAFSNNITATRYRRAAAHIRNTLKGQP